MNQNIFSIEDDSDTSIVFYIYKAGCAYQQVRDIRCLVGRSQQFREYQRSRAHTIHRHTQHVPETTCFLSCTQCRDPVESIVSIKTTWMYYVVQDKDCNIHTTHPILETIQEIVSSHVIPEIL